MLRRTVSVRAVPSRNLVRARLGRQVASRQCPQRRTPGGTAAAPIAVSGGKQTERLRRGGPALRRVPPPTDCSTCHADRQHARLYRGLRVRSAAEHHAHFADRLLQNADDPGQRDRLRVRQAEAPATGFISARTARSLSSCLATAPRSASSGRSIDLRRSPRQSPVPGNPNRIIRLNVTRPDAFALSDFSN